MGPNREQATLLAATSFAAGAVVASVLRLLFARRRSAPDLIVEEDLYRDAIYLDYNGTTPIYPQVLNSMMDYLTTHFGNPGSSHILGDAPKAALARARTQLLQLLGEESGTIVFTGCGTEADNLAIHLALLDKHDPHIVSTNIEHPAVTKYLEWLQDTGQATVEFVRCQKDGRVSCANVMAAIQSNTVLVCVMLANNETGAVQPVAEIARACGKRRIPVFTDAAQATGKIPIQNLNVDYMTIVGHKIGAPKGIACLYIRGDEVPSRAGLLLGGGQEFGLRAGTENVPYIVGLGTAASLISINRHAMETLRFRLLKRLQDALGDDSVVVHGPVRAEDRLPNTLSIAFVGLPSSTALLQAVRTQVCASAGATCHAGSSSSVLSAMNIPDDLAKATIRLSLGPRTTVDEIDRAAAVLSAQVKRLRRQVREMNSNM